MITFILIFFLINLLFIFCSHSNINAGKKTKHKRQMLINDVILSGKLQSATPAEATKDIMLLFKLKYFTRHTLHNDAPKHDDAAFKRSYFRFMESSANVEKIQSLQKISISAEIL